MLTLRVTPTATGTRYSGTYEQVEAAIRGKPTGGMLVDIHTDGTVEVILFTPKNSFPKPSFEVKSVQK